MCLLQRSADKEKAAVFRDLGSLSYVNTVISCYLLCKDNAVSFNS